MGAIKGSSLRTVVCPVCGEFESKKLTLFDKHLRDVHGTETRQLWDVMNGGPGLCGCGCGRTTTWINWWQGYSKFINRHSSSIYKAFSKEKAEEISRKRSESLRGRSSWCKGLSKENDERIAERAVRTSTGRKKAFDEGKITPWNKGKTTEDDERIAAGAETLKKMYADGELTPWAKGLSSDDEKIKRMAVNVSLAMRQENIRKRLDAIKRLSQDDIKLRVEASGNLIVVGGLDSYVNDAQKIINVICRGCGESFTGSLRSLQYGKCFKCSPGGSRAQESIAKWLGDLGLEVKRNDRKVLGGMEIDILVGDVGIEYNGLYWHSHANKSPQYHNNKSVVSRNAGVKLVHIFEDEWRDKSDIVKSMIMSKLGLSQNRIGARKCFVKELSQKEKKEFFEKNHIDGDTPSVISWGLEFDGEMIYAVSLRKPFHKKEKTIEVARCCPAINFNVQGGLSRLIKVAEEWSRKNGYMDIMTYVDTRFGGSGEAYKKAGFKKIKHTPPRFWWTDFTSRFNRFKFRADKSRGLTENAVAEAAGVIKIWGCENVVYSMHLD